MARITYYPEYHGQDRTPGTASRMPSFLVQTGHIAANWTIHHLPTWVYPQINGKGRRGKMIPARVPIGGHLHNPTPLALQPPASGQSYLPSATRGRFLAPSMAEPRAALRPGGNS